MQGKASLAPAEYDKLILDASIMNAALEILPESLASMAIIPLQLRLVHRIGKSYGYPMDMSQAKDFVATLGVGLTGQYVEQLGRKLLGGLLGGLAGGLGRAAGHQVASSGMSFATTYALGRLAQRYYAAGRSIDTAMLKQTFAALAGRSARHGAAVSAADRAAGEHHRHPQPRLADQAGLRPSPGVPPTSPAERREVQSPHPACRRPLPQAGEVGIRSTTPRAPGRGVRGAAPS